MIGSAKTNNLTWSQVFFHNLQVFILGVSLVTCVVMMSPSIMPGFIIPFLAREVKTNVDMPVTGDLIVAQLVIWRNIINNFSSPESELEIRLT